MATESVLIDLLERIIYGGVAITTAAVERAAGPEGLTFQQWRAIVIAGESAEGYRVGEIARRVPATLAATSRLLRRLERRGLVTLTRDERDRRATLARLTDEGARVRTSVLAYRREQIAATVATVGSGSSSQARLDEVAHRIERYGR